MHTKHSTIAQTISLIASVASFAVLFPTAVEACMICVPYPKTTLADTLIKSESIVMARENSEKAYVFNVIEVLKGATDAHDIEAFVNSAARRNLKQNPEDVVVLVRNATESAWRYLRYADIEYQRFIRTILEHSDRWNGLGGSERRVAFFKEYLTDDNQHFREQAYLEVGRAPYSAIKTIAGSVPRDQIRIFLANWRLMEWHSLYILMLGQSLHPNDHDLIRDKFEKTARFGLTTNLSAWATAYIEINPEAGIEEIEALYFGKDDRTRDELEEVHKSLSVLGSEGGALAEPRFAKRLRRIVKSYAILLEHHPTMAGKVAKDLTNWRSRALVDQLSSIMKSETMLDPDSKLAVSYYLSMASRFRPIK
jgi:hypothetical protein